MPGENSSTIKTGTRFDSLRREYLIRLLLMPTLARPGMLDLQIATTTLDDLNAAAELGESFGILAWWLEKEPATDAQDESPAVP